jgi:hypothetical protein
MRKRAICLGFAFLLLIVHGYGQHASGRISGGVFDNTDARIGGAEVKATNVDTGTQIAVTSNHEGDFVLFPLQPGVYDITVGATGFRGERVSGIRVGVAAVIHRDIQLQVGDVQQSVVISAAAQPILTQSGSVESTINREQIEALSLNGRDFNQLVLLAAGAVENTNPAGDFGPVSANGNRAFSNDYLLDGTPNNNVFGGGSAAAVSVDVIKEFKVISDAAPAEYGQAGTQVTIVTRSGTNRFHGSAFEYHRGNTWQAANPFQPGAAQPFDRNQFGGSIGGPVRRDHTFFFFNYEGNRQSETATVVSTVPPEAFWKGDFSSILPRIVVRDPLDASKPAFPGNIIPASRLNPTALGFRPYWGLPTQPGLANNAVENSVASVTADQFTIRMDHTLPRNQNVSLRYTQANSYNGRPSILGTGPRADIGQNNTNTNASWTAPFSPTTINELRLGLARQVTYNVYQTGGLPTTDSLGMLGFDPNNSLRQSVPRIAFTGNDAFTTLNYGPIPSYGLPTQNQKNDTFSLTETLTHVRGVHIIKAGFDYRHLRLPSILQPASAGVVTFNSAAATSTGYSFGDFVLGLPASSQQSPPMAPVVLKEQDIAAFLQDDWRVARRLTLSFGLRYELLLNPYEEKNRFALFDPANGAIVVASDNGVLPTGQFSPVVVAKLSDGKGGFTFPLLSDKQAGYNPRRLTDTGYKNFGPRFGFAYDISQSGKFLVRGGYGIFYTQYPFQYLEQTMATNPPFAGTFNYTQKVTNGVPAITLQNPYGGSATATIAPSGLVQNFARPSNQQWNLTTERDLGWNTALSLGYVGNKGTHLYRSVNANAAYLDLNGNLVRQFSSIYGTNAINVRRTDATSIYHAMQAEFRHRAGHGLMFQGNWTWAKGLDNTGNTVNGNALDVQNLGRDRALSQAVRNQMFKVNGTYDLPFGRGRALLNSAPGWANAIAGGWRLSGIWMFATGLPLTPSFTAAGGLGNNRPDVVYGVQANLPVGERTPTLWFNPAAFVPVPAVDPVTGKPRFGNAGRNIIIGPRSNTVDTSLSRASLYSERATGSRSVLSSSTLSTTLTTAFRMS